MSPTTSPQRRGSALAAVAVAALALAGCASSNGSAGDPSDADIDRAAWTIDAVFLSCDGGEELATCEGTGRVAPYQSLAYEDVEGEEVEVCVLVPHVADPVWLGINYGVVTEAERLGVKLQFNDAGGYTNIAEQNSQVEDCVAQGVQAVVIGAVSADALDPVLAIAQDSGVKVIDGGNGINSGHVDARAVLDYYQMGQAVGQHLAGLDEELTVALLPGPAGAGWSERSVVGFRDAIADSKVTLTDVRYGDPVKEVQAGLVEDTLAADPDIDVIVGTGVTAEVAAIIAEERGLSGSLGIYSTYISPTLTSLIENGAVTCAPNDQGVYLARIMMDLAVRSALGLPFEQNINRAAPAPVLVCGPAAGAADNFDSFDSESAFAPSNWSPVANVN